MPRPPISLIFIAVVFIIYGVLASYEMIAALLENRLLLNLGVIQIFTGIGLLLLRPFWRIVALIFTVFGIIFLLVAVPLFFIYGSSMKAGFFGLAITRFAVGYAILFTLLYLAFQVWQFRVLTRPDIRSLFTR